MKFLQSTLIIITLFFFSCDKDKDNDVVPNPLEMRGILKFDGNLNDSMGRLGTASVAGAPGYVTDRHGNANRALFLNGSTRVSYPGFQLNGTALTISLWVKQAAPAAPLAFIVKAGDQAGNAQFTIAQSNDRLGLSISTPFTSSSMSGSLDNNWHHIVGTYDGADIRLYVDGTASIVIPHFGSFVNPIENLVLGYFSPIYFTGSIDDLRIYNKVLTAAQIDALN